MSQVKQRKIKVEITREIKEERVYVCDREKGRETGSEGQRDRDRLYT